MPFVISSHLVYVSDPLAFFTFKYMVTSVYVGGLGRYFSSETLTN